MDIKKYFLKVQESYREKLPFFEHKIAGWERRKRKSLYKQAKLLFDDAQACEKEIIAVFETSDWKYNKAFLKVKIHALEELTKELMVLTRSWWLRWVEASVIVLGVALLLRNFFFGIYYVPTTSSEPTLLVGDRIWATKYIYLFEDPQQGDMVMFEDPKFIYDQENMMQCWWQRYVGLEILLLGLKMGPEIIAKRVIAVPGDVIEGKLEHGRPVIYRNGKKLQEHYVNTYPLLALKKDIGLVTGDTIGSITIPEIFKRKSKIVLYSYDPKKDFEEQPFYYIDYQDVLYDQKTGYMRMYQPFLPVRNKAGRIVDIFGPYIVPENKYWVMGDNRRNSVDSREWEFINKSKISGKASFVIWSLDSEEPIWFFELIKNPFRFLAALRLNRFFNQIE